MCTARLYMCVHVTWNGNHGTCDRKYDHKETTDYMKQKQSSMHRDMTNQCQKFLLWYNQQFLDQLSTCITIGQNLINASWKCIQSAIGVSPLITCHSWNKNMVTCVPVWRWRNFPLKWRIPTLGPMHKYIVVSMRSYPQHSSTYTWVVIHVLGVLNWSP